LIACRYKAIEVMAGGTPDKIAQIEYWHDNVEKKIVSDSLNTTTIVMDGAGWKKDQPPTNMIRVPGLVHETSTLYASDDLEKDPHASVDSNYRPHRTDNVYVTGGALFPTSGSWNREPLSYSLPR
jgi:choline dehydrogenase-like flavoprotein